MTAVEVKSYAQDITTEDPITYLPGGGAKIKLSKTITTHANPNTTHVTLRSPTFKEIRAIGSVVTPKFSGEGDNRAVSYTTNYDAIHRYTVALGEGLDAIIVDSLRGPDVELLGVALREMTQNPNL